MKSLDYAETVIKRIKDNPECSLHRALLILNLARAGAQGMTIPQLAYATGMAECSVSQALSGLYEPTGATICKKHYHKLNRAGEKLASELFTVTK